MASSSRCVKPFAAGVGVALVLRHVKRAGPVYAKVWSLLLHVVDICT